ncbi:radical SAM protein [Pelosinus sp. IPA-1]|uniref:radical SAM/SPASM domain-containing protein n=1 Tax=Pelosinus sp. IPA-1 TaxID=3029569 RepID=UPI00243614DC|nr:radical SAM protein [Pelosinus sp. IPA-1]GMB00332.1 heme biosynthesis protein [Pelosinus sp. IPA-1]
MYYRLKPHCALVEGAVRGAIYDFQSGKVFSINKGAVEMLKACQGNPLEDFMDINAPDTKPYIAFLDDLTRKELGVFYAIDPGETPPLPKAETEVKLSFLWLELTSCCNNRCLHCYATSGPTVNNDCVPHDRWLSLISEAREAGATAIQLIGGEPLLYTKWRELAIKAHEDEYEFIEIFSNATLIDDDCVNFFKQYNIHVATTIYADNATTHDKITLNQGSFERTMDAVKKIIAAGVDLRIASIIMKDNEDEAEKIVKLCQDLGVQGAYPDVVRPTGRGDDLDLLPNKYHKPPIRPPFYTDMQSFLINKEYNNCLMGKIAITSNGDVIPCIFARDQIAGSILNQPLKEVLTNESLQSCWCATKDAVEKCKDCEYRYACGDCRPLAQGSDPDKRWRAPSPQCDYNPYLGKWAEKEPEDIEDTKITKKLP